jgi:hypothetical protein
MTGNKAFLECRCGACRITLCDPNMRYRLECLCCDCRQRGLISASKRPDNALPTAVARYERGVDDYYFANAFLVDEPSRDLLTFSKLREDAFNTTAMSACCGTLMCGTHPVYEGASVSVNADSCRVSVPRIIATQVVLFGCDFPEDKYSKVQTRTDIPMLFSVYDEIDGEPMLEFLKAVTEPMTDAYKHDGFTTFEALCEEKTIAIDNSFFEESRMGKPIRPTD